MASELMMLPHSVELGDGYAVLMGDGEVDIFQEDTTLPARLGMSREQRIMLEGPELRRMRRAIMRGRDWRSRTTRGFYMGDGLMVLEQVDDQAPWRGSPSYMQRTVVSLDDADALIRLAA